MTRFEEIVDIILTVFCPQLDPVACDMIQSDHELQDDEFAVDSFLQFTLLEGFEVPEELLRDIEAEVRAGWDDELVERTLGWIVKHREKNAAA